MEIQQGLLLLLLGLSTTFLVLWGIVKFNEYNEKKQEEDEHI
jgi:hypothetical protein